MPDNLGAIGSAFVEISAEANKADISKAVDQAKAQAKQEAGQTPVTLPPGWIQGSDGRGPILDPARFQSRGPGAAELLAKAGNVRNDDFENRHALRMQRGFAEGDVMQRLARFAERPSQQEHLREQIRQERLVLDAQKRIDYARIAATSGQFTANLTKAKDALAETFGLTLTRFGTVAGIVGVAAAGVHLAQRQHAEDMDAAAFANPLAAWRRRQAARDREAVEGRRYVDQLEQETERDRNIAIGKTQMEREGGNWLYDTWKGIKGFVSHPFDKTEEFLLAGQTARGRAAGLTAFGAGGFENTGQRYDAMGLAAAFQAEVSQSYRGDEKSEAVKQNTDAITKLTTALELQKMLANSPFGGSAAGLWQLNSATENALDAARKGPQ